MSRLLPHLLLNTNIQKNRSVVMKYNYGFGEKQESEGNNVETKRDYISIGRNLEAPYIKFRKARSQRVSHRNQSLIIPFHVDYVRINFWGQFAVNEYFQRWYEQFGLEVVEVSDFGTSILFGVTDFNHNKFETFLSAVDTVIRNAKDHQERQYPKLINYIKDFELLTTADILKDVYIADVFILKFSGKSCIG